MARISLCSIPDCGKSSCARKLCQKHYRRLMLTGDPLTSKSTIKGAPQRFYSDVLLTYQGNECVIWPFSKTPGGYGQMHVDGVSVIVSRRLCEEVNGPPPTPKHQAAHSCGRGLEGCVTQSHLSWKTRKENEADKLLHGTHNRGEKHPLAKLNSDQVMEILALGGSDTKKNIAKRFGISSTSVFKILSGETWKHINR